MPGSKVRRPIRQRIKVELVIAIAATIVSFCALGTSMYQTHIMKQQQYAAVWPRLHLYHGWVVGGDRPFYSLSIKNAGIGPAIIRNITIEAV